MQGLAELPVARYLQHGRATQTPVREQQVFQKDNGGGLLAFATFGQRGDGRADLDFQRQAGQLGERRPLASRKGQGDQGGAQRYDAMPQLGRQPLAKVRRTDLGNRQAARGDHDLVRLDQAHVGVQLEARGFGRCRHA